MKQTIVTLNDVELALRHLSAEMREVADGITQQARELREQIASLNGEQVSTTQTGVSQGENSRF